MQFQLQPATLGSCPICESPLKRSGLYLECPGGDYRIPEKTFNDIWDRYNQADLLSDGLDLIEKLLRELRDGNIK